MQRCESQKAILDELESEDCDQNHNSKKCRLMYKRLQREHLVLQHSFAALTQALNHSLSKSQSTDEFASNVPQNEKINFQSNSLKRQMSSHCKQREKIEINGQTEGKNNSSIPVIIYKRLCKEHVVLQRSFATICQSLNEAMDRDRDRDRERSQRPKQSISYSQQKKSNKKEMTDELKRQIEVLSLELQETRDQNELLEFRIHEFEQNKGWTKTQNLDKCLSEETDGKVDTRFHQMLKEIACIKCCELESQVLEVNNENQKLNERLKASETSLHQLISKYTLKEEFENLLLQRNYSKNNGIIDKLENRYIGSAMTSEDEGLGDDTRRDHSSGPSSLADTQEPDYDVISERSSQSNNEFTDKELSSDGSNENGLRMKTSSQQTESVVFEKDLILRQEVIRNKDLIRKLETTVEELKAEKANLEEQVLELEEAENDSRLMSQQLQQQLQVFVDQYETIQSDLINANKTIDLNNNKIKSFETIESELRNQIKEMKSILLKEYFIENHSNRTENQFIDETKKKVHQNNDLMNRSLVSDTKDRRVEKQLTPEDSLYSFLWEKLYRIETQIDCLQQSYSQTNQLFSCQESDDDLQLFISADKLSEGVSKIGCSFDVSRFDRSQDQLFNHCEASVRLDDLVLSLPLCETIKPERIDVMISNCPQSKVKQMTSQCLPSELMENICKLESNEQQLKERLIQLEWINKEFVKELELREKIFFERERNDKYLNEFENQLKLKINEIQNEIKNLEINEQNLKMKINCFNEKIETIYNENKLLVKDTQNCEKNSELNETWANFETQENECKLESNSDKCEEGLQILKDFKENCESINEKSETETQNTENISLITTSTDNCDEIEFKQRLNEFENQKTKVMNELQDICDKIKFLTKVLNEKQSELKKVRITHEERMSILSEEHTLVEKELRLKMQEMESQTSMTVNELELERNKIIKQFEENLNQIKDKECVYQKRIYEFNENVNKIEEKIMKLINNKNNFDKVDRDRVDREKMKLKIEMKAIQSSEEQLKSKLNEMMQKESAYEETLSKADKIIATLEHNYKQRIHELESSERNLNNKITRLEETESRLRTSLRPERRTTDSYRKSSDLVKQLIDCEARECTLRQQIKALELSVTQLEQQLEITNQTKNRIESDLKDQDELVTNVHSLQQQIDSLKSDLNKSLQSQDSLQDMLKETEKYYQKRDEEMQSKYKSLEDEKCFLEISAQQLRHQLRHQNKESFNSIDISSNNKIENIENVCKNTEELDEKMEIEINSDNNEELDTAAIHMEKCFKRAMDVVRQEIIQKDKIDGCLVTDNDMELSSSLSTSEEFNTEDLTDLSSSSSSKDSKPLAPNKLKILRKVSSDSLLIGWQNNDKDISYHQIHVNDSIIQRVRNPKATKTLIQKLNLSKYFSIKIKSFSAFGQSSDEAVVEYTPKESIQSSDDYMSDSYDSQITRL